MAKVTSSDLVSANQDNIDNLELVIETTSKVSSLLEDFVSSTPSTLKGTGYDMIRVKVSLYQKAYSMLNTVSENLKSILQGTNNSMINYMEGYSELDNAWLGEITSTLNQIASYIAYLASQSGKNGVDYSAEISRWTDIYNKLNHLKELVKGLSPKDLELFGNLENIITDVENIARMVHGINESTFTKEGLEALKRGDKNIYNFNPNEEIFTEEYKTPVTATTYGKWTEEELKSMTEQEVKNMSHSEFIEFTAALAQMVYQEEGGVLPSITIAQAILESGWGDKFESTSHNIYGLIGYPDNHGKVNRLKKFDSFYEATVYHAKYFKAYLNVYSAFLRDCANGDAYSAASYLGKYAGGSGTYGPSIQSLIRDYNLTQYDNI